MKNRILFFIAFICLLVASCSRQGTFIVEGVVSGAAGQTLYLERVLLASSEMLDSTRTDDSGRFYFKSSSPSVPAFYRLRMGNQIINLGIDSVEQVKILTDSAGFAVNYTVEGSSVCQSLKEITMKQQEVERVLVLLEEKNNTGLLSDTAYVREALVVIEEVKDFLKPYITSSPQSLSAYYALLQKVNKGFVFDPYDKDDFHFYALVTNVLKLYHPNDERTRNLERLALQALYFIRAESSEGNAVALPDAEDIGLIDIELPAVNGEIVTLSEYAKGSVTLLDFTIYEVGTSPLHNMLLGELYEKYHDRGFKIYQVSIDDDEHLWKNKASRLPWMCVLDGRAVHSRLLIDYNVTALPTSFIIDEKGDVVKRLVNEQELGEFLKGYYK